MRNPLTIVNTHSLPAILLPAVLLLAGTGTGQILGPLLGIERLANGNTLIADGGMPDFARLVEVDSSGQVVWAYLKNDIRFAHTARRLPNGNTLITATSESRVMEVNPAGELVWSMSAGLLYPNEAWRLANGNTLITDRNNARIIEVTLDSTIAWCYIGTLTGPHNASRLPNGNTLICDSGGWRVLEVDSAGNTVWEYVTTEPSRFRGAQRLTNGRTLLTNSLNGEILEVDSAGGSLWRYQAEGGPFVSCRLPDGNTLISEPFRTLEVDPDGRACWQWPGTVPVVVETTSVFNPGSGCSLYVHIHRPATATPAHRLPGVVLVPGELQPGTSYDSNRLADIIAADGFVVLHYDAEGRGRSPGEEDYGGFSHQDGLQACLSALAGQDCVNPSRIGVLTEGYGITTAAGMLARYPGVPPVSYVVDFEGPADRYSSGSDSGGPVPVPADSERFWVEREAARSIAGYGGSYLRVQTALDHHPRIPDGRSGIALVDSATGGAARWTRVNDSVMNPPNRTYTPADPPAWIPEVEEPHNLIRYLLYLRELARFDAPQGLAEAAARSPGAATDLTVRPNPVRRQATISFTLDRRAKVTARVLDVNGRLVRNLVTGPIDAGPMTIIWDGATEAGQPATPGVYFIHVRAGKTAHLRRVTKC